MALAVDIALEAARAVRPYLSDLLDSAEEAEAIDRGLADALAAPAPEGAAAAEALLLHPALSAWTLAFARFGVPEELVEPDVLRGLQALPGDGLPVRAARYRCPEGDDYVWYRRAAGPIARCPTHGVRLVRDAVSGP